MGSSVPESNLSSNSTRQPELNQVKKSPYQVAQQVKFLHLEAEIESLFMQLKTLKQQRTDSQGVDISDTSK